MLVKRMSLMKLIYQVIKVNIKKYLCRVSIYISFVYCSYLLLEELLFSFANILYLFWGEGQCSYKLTNCII